MKHPITQWVAEGFLLAYFILDSPSIFRKFTPGLKILRVPKGENLLFSKPNKSGWLYVGLAIRLAIMTGFIVIGIFILLRIDRGYLWASIFFYWATVPLYGLILYLSQNPYRVVVTDKYIRSYTYNMLEVDWKKISLIREKEHWVEFELIQDATRDIDYDDMQAAYQRPLLDSIKTRAKAESITYEKSRY
ncbi:MAG: hypothetical protein AAGI38_03615 [Bacteroidota bacterium]